MPRVTLQAYAEEHNLRIRYVFDEELCKNRKLITGFSSFEDVFQCMDIVKGKAGLFQKSEDEHGFDQFIEQLEPQSIDTFDINQIGVFVLTRFDLPYLREDRCSRCFYCRLYNERAKRNYCARTKRTGSIERAHWCEKFKHRNPSGLYYKDGIPVRSKTRDDYRTESQWLAVGRYVREGEEGVEMYSTMNTYKKYVYYLIEQTEECLD